jgi:pimeloyl-ACP methyl ester carboxylesterase
MRRSVHATRDEQIRRLPGDDLIPDPIGSLTHAITIQSSTHDVWPWIAQMGAGNRSGWYSYDSLDNGRHPSASRIVPELQNLKPGMLFPALPGIKDGFTLVSFEPERFLVLDWKAPDGAVMVTWAFVLEPFRDRSTRLITRARGGPGYQFHGLPSPIAKHIIRAVHFIMERKQLLGIARRAESSHMAQISVFNSREGKNTYLKAYDAAMKLWPVPFEEVQVQSRFGTTHVVTSGPVDAPPMVLLHGYMATLLMWSPNIADFSKNYRVYAVDVMGQPSKSIPDEPIRNSKDYVEWLTATLNALNLDRVFLVGMSYGGWLALTYGVAAPERIEALVLLSPGASFLPIVKQFSLRGMSMLWLPTRFTVNSFMRWLGFNTGGTDTDDRGAFQLMYLGMKHFRVPVETLRVLPSVFSDAELGAIRVPTLLLIGKDEVIYDSEAALARARRLIPELEGDLLPGCSHDMCFSQHRMVDARVLDFLKRKTAASIVTVRSRM